MDQSPSSWSSAIPSRDYAKFVRDDPMRNALHYPSVLQILGNVSGRHVLDLGCGDGRFDRLLAKSGANVTAFDIVPAQIEEAELQEAESPLGIRYEVADATTYVSDRLHHDAVSIMALPYATDPKALQAVFRTAFTAVMENGRFISVVFRPGFSAFGKIIGNRQFQQDQHGNIQVEFLHPITKVPCFTSHLTQFDKEQYEEGAHAAGFRKTQWIDPTPTPASLQKLGQEFWQTCMEERPYAIVHSER